MRNRCYAHSLIVEMGDERRKCEKNSFSLSLHNKTVIAFSLILFNVTDVLED